MTTISTSSNVTQPVGDPTSFLLAAEAGIKICNLISFMALAVIAQDIYMDPSLMNPWSERRAQLTWSSPEHLVSTVALVSSTASVILINIVNRVVWEKEKAMLNEIAARHHWPLIP